MHYQSDTTATATSRCRSPSQRHTAVVLNSVTTGWSSFSHLQWVFPEVLYLLFGSALLYWNSLMIAGISRCLFAFRILRTASASTPSHHLTGEMRTEITILNIVNCHLLIDFSCFLILFRWRQKQQQQYNEDYTTSKFVSLFNFFLSFFLFHFKIISITKRRNIM